MVLIDTPPGHQFIEKWIRIGLTGNIIASIPHKGDVYNKKIIQAELSFVRILLAYSPKGTLCILPGNHAGGNFLCRDMINPCPTGAPCL